MDFLFGVFGFAGFEGLRCYKRIIAGLPVVPKRSSYGYAIVLIVVGIFSGGCAYALAGENPKSALVIGFTVPTGLMLLNANPRGRTPKRFTSNEIHEYGYTEKDTTKTNEESDLIEDIEPRIIRPEDDGSGDETWNAIERIRFWLEEYFRLS